jgi:hypothetical protein
MITSDHLRELHRVLVDSFSEEEVRALLIGLGVPLDHITGGGDLSGRMFDVIKFAERAGWVPDLVRAALHARPRNYVLTDLASKLGLEPELSVQQSGSTTSEPWTPPATAGDSAKLPVNVTNWQLHVPDVSARVCRVEVGGRSVGTGFLVAPDVVMTFRRVLDLATKPGPSAIRCRFDYRILASGTTEGLVVALRQTKAVVADSSPPPDGPGCVLLQLSVAVGNQPIGPDANTGVMRGWLRVPDPEPTPTPGQPLIIAEYVTGEALRVVFGLDGVAELDADGIRLRHRLATDPLAAGAPCFDKDWNLIAVHLGVGTQPSGETFGEAVRIAAIRDWLTREGVAHILGSAVATRDVPPPEPGPIKNVDDPQSGRWGNRSQRNGRKLKATITDTSDRRLYTCDFTVESTDGSILEGPVVFHLHDSYPRSVINIRKIRDARFATLEEVTAYGVYTVGAQVKDGAGNWVGLELNLARKRSLPKRFREQ